MGLTQTQQFVSNFIDEVWNKQQFDKLDYYLHPNYVDHTLPTTFPTDKHGLQQWIAATTSSFQHQTLIQDQVTQDNKSVIKVEMIMTHIGAWRGIEPTNLNVSTKGYRLYHLLDGKIVEHWALIDGTTLEDQLRQQTGSGCQLPE